MSGDQPCFIATLIILHFPLSQQFAQHNNYGQNANKIAILFHYKTDTTICTMQLLFRCGVPVGSVRLSFIVESFFLGHKWNGWGRVVTLHS